MKMEFQSRKVTSVQPQVTHHSACRPAARRLRHFSSLGFTVLEMTVAFGLATIVAAAVATSTLFTARGFQAAANYSDLSRASRKTLDVLTRDVRQAKALTSFATNRVVFTDLTNGTFSYTWDARAGTLTRTYNGSSNVVLTSCDSLVFHISQRSPSNNFTFWPASSATNAKLIDVTWTCSRPLFGQKANTESIQTAKITIRN
jgi:type II secretory pathway pseudopilin PulG